jgi:hypothetical protein
VTPQPALQLVSPRAVLNSVAVQIPYQFTSIRQCRVRCSKGLGKGRTRIAVRRQGDGTTAQGSSPIQKCDCAGGPDSRASRLDG